jgi:hypothetical protein
MARRSQGFFLLPVFGNRPGPALTEYAPDEYAQGVRRLVRLPGGNARRGGERGEEILNVFPCHLTQCSFFHLLCKFPRPDDIPFVLIRRPTVHLECPMERFHPILFDPVFRVMNPDFDCAHGMPPAPVLVTSASRRTARVALYSILDNSRYPATVIMGTKRRPYMQNYPRRRLFNCSTLEVQRGEHDEQRTGGT